MIEAQKGLIRFLRWLLFRFMKLHRIYLSFHFSKYYFQETNRGDEEILSVKDIIDGKKLIINV